MRIALIYDCIFPYVKGGGERTFAALAAHLAPRHEVHLFGMNFWGSPRVRQLGPGIWAHGVCQAMPLYTHDLRRRRSIKGAFFFASCLTPRLLAAGRFDIMDCMATPYLPLYAARIAASLARTPLVSTWLEVWPKEQWRAYLGPVRGSIAKRVERLASRLPDHILANSAQTRENLLGLGVPQARVSVITPGIDCDYIRAVPKGACESDVIYVGRLIKEKRVDVLLEAVAALRTKHPGILCRIVGDGPERDRLQTAAAELGIQRNVVFMGFLREAADVYSAMKASKVFVLPSQREGFGIVVLEAAACGLPVVTVDDPGNAARHLVAQGQLGSISRVTPEDLAGHMETLLRERSLCQRYRENGLAWSAGFDWGRIAEQVEITYQSVISPRESQSSISGPDVRQDSGLGSSAG